MVEAARQLGPEVTQRCKARFAELAAGQPTVSVRSLVASLGILGSVPAIQQLWLFTAVDHTVRGSQAGDPRAGPAVVDLVTQSRFERALLVSISAASASVVLGQSTRHTTSLTSNCNR